MRHAKQFKVSRRKFGGRLHRSLLGCYYRLTYLPDSRARAGAGAGAQRGRWRGGQAGDRLWHRVPECSGWTARAHVLLLLLLRQFAEAEMETEGVRWRRHVKIFSKVNATKRTKAHAKRETRFQLRHPRTRPAIPSSAATPLAIPVPLFVHPVGAAHGPQLNDLGAHSCQRAAMRTGPHSAETVGHGFGPARERAAASSTFTFASTSVSASSSTSSCSSSTWLAVLVGRQVCF